MGKILNIRLYAYTYNEEDLAVAWPGLCSLVWPFWAYERGLRPKGAEEVTRPGLIEDAIGKRPHGVLELVEALRDGLKFGDWPSKEREGLAPGIGRAVGIQNSLNQALADWQPQPAMRFSDELEAELGQLEKVRQQQLKDAR